MKFLKKIPHNYQLTILLSCISLLQCAAGNTISRVYKYVFPLTQFQLDFQLLKAVEMGDLEALKKALQDGANIHAIEDSALCMAARMGYLSIVNFLLELPEEKRADVHACADYALRIAVMKGDWIIAACLLEHGANPDRLSPEETKILRNSLGG